MVEKLEPMPVMQTAHKPFWSHPVFSEYLDEVLQGAECVTRSQIKQIEDHFNCELYCGMMEYDAPDELIERYGDGDNSALLDWKPTPPSGKPGWFIVMICDTEDGAQVWWAIPKVDPEYFKI